MMDANQTCHYCAEQTEFMYRYGNGWYCEQHKSMGRNYKWREFSDSTPMTYRNGMSIRKQRLLREQQQREKDD